MCQFDRPVISEGSIFYNIGFCKLKRTTDWVHLNPIENLMEEERQICLIVIADPNLDKLRKTIDSTKKYPDITQIIVSFYKIENESLQKSIEILKGCGKEWSIDNITSDQIKTGIFRVDYCSKYIKKNWFYCLKSGNKVGAKKIEAFLANLHKNESKVLAFKGKNDKYDYIINTSVFKDIDGNGEFPCLEKIQKMDDNWRELCKIT